MWKDFKKFALKGNVIDLAVGVIIGAAFGKIVSSLVNDIIMPLIGLVLGKIDFSNLFIAFENGDFNTIEEAKAAGVATLNYGLFINNIIDFLIISFSIFFIIKQIDKLFKKQKKEEISKTKKCKYCYSDIHIEATRCPNCTSIIED